MGLKNDGFATVWDSPQKRTENMVSMRLTTSYKDKNTDSYVQDFSGFVTFTGKNAAPTAMKLKHGDRIKILKCEVTSRYDKDKEKEFVNYKIFDFELLDGKGGKKKKAAASQKKSTSAFDAIDEAIDLTDDELPF